MNIGFKKQYFKDLAELEAGNFWFCARNRLLIWAIRRYAPRMKSFLEIGCGTGFVISAIADSFPGTRMMGSEYLKEGLEYAQLRLPSAEFMQLDARSIPFESEFDVVGAFDVLEHIAEDETVLIEIYKSLMPGGVFCMTVPQHRWLWSQVDEFACHVRRYTSKELSQKVEKIGFEIVRSTSFVTLLLPVMYFSRFSRGNVDVADVSDVAGLRLNPVVNRILGFFLHLDYLLIQAGFSLPFGGSRLLIARKPLL